jgi:hypothetical protein
VGDYYNSFESQTFKVVDVPVADDAFLAYYLLFY